MRGFYEVSENGMGEDRYGSAFLRGGFTSILTWSATEAHETDS